MYNVKLLNKISKIGLDKFTENYSYSEDMKAADAIMVRSASMHEMELEESTLCVARAGAGVNNIPVDDLAKKGVVVFNTPGANANAVKELVLAGLFLSSRKIIPAAEWALTLKGSGAETLKLVEKGKSQFTGPEILGKTLGVIGLGAIGALVANAAIALGMDVVGYDPFLSPEANLNGDIKVYSDLEDIYKNSDYITVHVPLNDSTRGMINKDAISSMRDGVKILNFSRDALVSDTDILEALESGKVSRYVTDFPTDSVIGAENVVALPHLGASTPESEDNCAKMAAAEIMDYLENGNIKNSVNMPKADMGKIPVGFKRVCVILQNDENTVANVTAAVSTAEKHSCFTKKGYAYIMADAKNADEIAKKLNLDGVIRVRVI